MGSLESQTGGHIMKDVVLNPRDISFGWILRQASDGSSSGFKKSLSQLCTVRRPGNQLRDGLKRGLLVISVRKQIQNSLSQKRKCTGSCNQTKERDRSGFRGDWIQGLKGCRVSPFFSDPQNTPFLVFLLSARWRHCLLPT